MSKQCALSKNGKGGEGLIFNIEKCAVHDGPGIRTVVFFKGCPLRCRWCSSPQSWKPVQEVALRIDSCIKCGACFEVCPVGAIKPDIREYIRIDRELCTNCGLCCEVCSPKALRLIGQYMTVEEVFSVISQDILFYRNSNGGVTLSGGEPTAQPEFILALLNKCHSQGIHTAIESYLHVRWEVMRRIISGHLDLIYADIKHMNPEMCRKLTGKSNELALENIKNIASETETELILRLPLIPKHNDDPENLTELARFAKGLNIKRIEILPYHNYGVSMYKWLGMDYTLSDLQPPERSCVEEAKHFIESRGLDVQIGG